VVPVADVIPAGSVTLTPSDCAELVPLLSNPGRLAALSPAGSQAASAGRCRAEHVMLDAEAAHRDHAIVEQVIADLKNSALGHLPSGQFSANGAWLVCAVMVYNLTRAAGALAGALHAKARTAIRRTRLISVPARIARSARRLQLHLPADRPFEPGLDDLFRRALHDPVPTATT